MDDPVLVTYRIENRVATLTLDDGKSNALSPRMFKQINAALDRAAEDAAAVVITGREGVLSAGFDLKVLRGGGVAALGMLRAGFELEARLLSFPIPVVMACPGHAIAMGVFMLLCGDYRIGAAGPFKVCVNEVAIGMTVPRCALAVCRQRLAPSHLQRAAVLAEMYAPEGALEAGFFDRIVPPGEVLAAARQKAEELTALNRAAHHATKLIARRETLQTIRREIKRDLGDAFVMGLKQRYAKS